MNYKIKNDKFQEILKSLEVVEELKGRVGDSIIKYKNSLQEIIYIKYAEGSASKVLEREYRRLDWLRRSDSKILFPQIIFFAQEESCTVLVISNVPGEQSQRVGKVIGKEKSIEIVAKSLKAIHAVNPTKDLPIVLDNLIEEYSKALSSNQINIDDFKSANDGKSPEEVLKYLVDNKKLVVDLVFTHGDFCLPNIMIDTNLNYGVIDWANAGLCDRYMDFSAIEGSIKRNFGEEYIEYFYKCYGLDFDKVDRAKIKYFQLIDQFSYNRNDALN